MMKIKKLNEARLVEEEEKLSDINPQEASTTEIADAVQASVENTTDDKVTLSDTNAAKVAQEIKSTAAEVDAGQAAIIPSEEDESKFKTENELTKTLDRALASARKNMRRGGKSGSNVLVTGLPGSGKTAIVYAWCNAIGLKPFYLDAKDPNLETVINGMPLRDITVKDSNAIDKAYSQTLAPLHRPNSVLFLDELNRQIKPHIRASLLTLINEKEVSGKDETGHDNFRDTLLFTVACINPSVPTDKGAAELNDAEKSRFLYQIDYDSTTEAAEDYFKKHFDRLISKLDKKDPNYEEDLVDYLKSKDLAVYIVSHPTFTFDSRDDLDELADGSYNMLNQRLLTDALSATNGDKDEMLFWIEHYSNLRPAAKEMLMKIVEDYQVDIRDLKKAAGIVDSESEEQQEAPADAETQAEEPTTDGEDDADLFASGTDTSGIKVKSPGETAQDWADVIASW